MRHPQWNLTLLYARLIRNIWNGSATAAGGSCFYAYKEHLFGNYYLMAADSMTDLCLAFRSDADTLGVYPAIVAFGIYEVLRATTGISS